MWSDNGKPRFQGTFGESKHNTDPCRRCHGQHPDPESLSTLLFSAQKRQHESSHFSGHLFETFCRFQGSHCFANAERKRNTEKLVSQLCMGMWASQTMRKVNKKWKHLQQHSHKTRFQWIAIHSRNPNPPTSWSEQLNKNLYNPTQTLQFGANLPRTFSTIWIHTRTILLQRHGDPVVKSAFF